MKQLAQALRNVGYLPSNELRAQRDAAIGALVKARKAKKKSAPLKARVLTLVGALKVPTPIGALITLLAVFLVPSIASAHPGHDGHHGPDMNGPGALVLVGVTLGLAAHAWAQWGPRRRLVATVEGPSMEIPGGPDEGPQHGPELQPYFTVRIPYTLVGQTQWHPTEDTGPFSTLTRGCYRSLDAARAWADSHLGATAYSVVLVAFDSSTGEDTLTTVYTFNPDDDRVIRVGGCDSGEECEHTNEHGEPCGHKPSCWSIRDGSGYVVACDRHAHDLVESAVLDGDIYRTTEGK